MPLTDKERLATLEADHRNLTRRLEGHHGTLYGTQGQGGINAEIQTVASELRHHVKDEAEASDRITEVLVGTDGKNGLVGQRTKDRKDIDRLLLYAKILVFLASIVAADLVRRLIAWLASLGSPH